ncbi:hypothetical protein CHARACLAT_013220, partial [Characodon lateralis]|nr:hypothetical protein [Characodon lateralis]
VDGLLKANVSCDDSDLEAHLNSWNLGIENPRYSSQALRGITPLPMIMALKAE